MAGPTRRPPPAVADELLAHPRRFAFIQVVRLLKLLTGQTSGNELQDFYEETLRVRADLSLGFPGVDVTELTEIPRDGEENKRRFRITATFLGLYGSSSPLPTFYSEELLDEAREDHSGLRDFLDILNNGFFIKLYKAWARNRLAVRIVEEQDDSSLERAFCLIGMGHRTIRERFSEAYSALRYAGLYSQYPRSALGLKTILSDRLGGAPVRIEQCVPQKLPVPQDQRHKLGVSGCTLGEDAVLGCQVADRMGKVGAVVGPLSADDFQALLPGTDLHRAVEEHIRLYQVQPLPYDLTCIVREREYDPATLGGDRWSKLGLDTWLFSGDRDEPGAVTFAKNRPKGPYAERACPHGNVGGAA